MTLFVNKIPIRWKEQDIRKLFEVYGSVSDIVIPMDRRTRQGRGFAFVTMDVEDDGYAAIKALSGIEYDERVISVEPAAPKTTQPIKTEQKPKESYFRSQRKKY